MKYRVTHKGRDCKDDMKLFKYADSKSKSSLLPWMWFLNGLFDDLAKKRKKFLVALNYEYKGTDTINSSLKSHSLFVTMHKNKIIRFGERVDKS